MSERAILIALRDGPRTNAELQDMVCDHAGGIARDCAHLIDKGSVRRVDGGHGRGSRARYALVEPA
jgi:hypothetical protein